MCFSINIFADSTAPTSEDHSCYQAKQASPVRPCSEAALPIHRRECISPVNERRVWLPQHVPKVRKNASRQRTQSLTSVHEIEYIVPARIIASGWRAASYFVLCTNSCVRLAWLLTQE